MAPQLPKVVLPRFEVMSKSPIDALSEIRNSLSATAASIEAALPFGGQGLPFGGLGGIKLPKIEQIFKGPTAAIEEIKSTFEKTMATVAPGSQGGQGAEQEIGKVTREANQIIKPFMQH